MEIVMLVGLMASGKSTFFRKHFAGTHRHISKDTMSRHGRRERQARLLTQALEDGSSVVIDNTNVSVEERAEVMDIARAAGVACIVYVMDVPLAESLTRNIERPSESRVPPVGYWSAVDRFVKPSYSEGFYQINIVKPEADGFTIRSIAR